MSEVQSPLELGALLAACVAATDMPIAVADATREDFPLVYVNPAYERVTGFLATESLGRPGRFLPPAARRHPAAEAMRERLRAGFPAHARVLSKRPDGSTWWNEVHVTPVRDAAGVVTHLVGVQQDVSDRVAAEERSTYAVTHDSLTGLANRPHFVHELDRELARARRDRVALAVLFLDIDRFKATNDTHGHAVGDALLAATARRLQGRLRGQDLAARYGGDEFVVLLPDLPLADAYRAASVVVEDLRRALVASVEVEGTGHRISISIGVSIFPRDSLTAGELVAAADAAMYAEKFRRRPT